MASPSDFSPCMNGEASLNIQMECSATFFATYSLGREEVEEESGVSWLKRSEGKLNNEWAQSGILSPFLPLILLGELFLLA